MSAFRSMVVVACVALAGCANTGNGFGGDDGGGFYLDMHAAGGDGGAHCDAGAGACTCASDSDCGGATPRCDRNASRCVPCLPESDNCPNGSRCVLMNGSFTCTAACHVDVDCPKTDGGAQAQCCEGACLDTSSDTKNCGGCGKLCPDVANGLSACTGGTCGIGACNPGFADCDGMAANGCEINTGGDAKNCGGCAKACNGGANAVATCDRGACVLACSMGYADCDMNAANGCEVDTTSDPANCGGCGMACGALPNATTACVSGACAVGSCNAGYLDCNRKAQDGCEVEVRGDVNNCGSCGHACVFANAAAACNMGICAIGMCNMGYSDCDGLPGNGCETATQSDIKNCGACGRNCSGANSTQACQMGTCVISACAPGFADCDGNPANGCEINVAMDPMNCGGCGKACMAAPNATVTCVNATCAVTGCKFGFADCNKNLSDGCESNLLSTMSCGGCGIVCMAPTNASAGCNAGICGIGMCDPLWGNCDGNAANGCEKSLTADVNNCGSCNNVCVTPNGVPECLGGQCGVASCNPGWSDCDGNQANGCEVMSASDPGNCGKCGNVCPAPANASPVCTNSTCGASCNMGFADCNMMVGDGCEVSVATDVGNCGSCGHVCAQIANGTVACKSGACAVGACAMGFADCDGVVANGCERNLNTDTSNCGKCGNACAVANATAVCQNGACGYTQCNAGYADCDGNAANGCEVNINTSASNCGKCGNVCPMNAPSCSAGTCTLGCDPATEVSFNGHCYYLDGSGGNCDPGYQLASQSVLNSIANQFVGKNYKHTVSQNCCIQNADAVENWGFGANQCNLPGPWAMGPTLGGAGCSNVTNRSAQQLTFCFK